MIIYGVALLSVCTLTGITVGQILGKLIGVPANVGGVGIAMILLILAGGYLQKKGYLNVKNRTGH
jgi:malonate transporter MadL subunit